jgi:hypothetical protein
VLRAVAVDVQPHGHASRHQLADGADDRARVLLV